MSIDAALEYYADHFSEELNVALVRVLAYPSQGGLGYEIAPFDPWLDYDGWEVDTTSKRIYIDTRGLWGGEHDPEQLARQLRGAIEVHFLERASMLSRVGWGTGKVVLGLVEVGTGFVGIIVPEPGTTAGGVVLVTLGANSLTDGFTQLAGANDGHGINPLGEVFAAAGSSLADLAGLDPELGDQVGRGTFFVASIAMGSYASIRVMSAPNAALRFGVGGQPGGLEVGRVHLMMPNMRGNGMTLFSVLNNKNQSILRFVFQDGRLYANGRIVGVPGGRILQHESNWRVIVKGLLKLLWHGAKEGL